MTRAHIKWIKYALLGLLAFCGLTGCHTLRLPFMKYYYTVSIINESKRPIWVDPFMISPDKDSEFGGGEVRGESGIAPFFSKPSRHVTIKYSYYIEGTDPSRQTDKTEVHLELKIPKEFTRKKGAEVRFYINPEKNSVRIGYGIWIGKTYLTKIIFQDESKKETNQ